MECYAINPSNYLHNFEVPYQRFLYCWKLMIIKCDWVFSTHLNSFYRAVSKYSQVSLSRFVVEATLIIPNWSCIENHWVLLSQNCPIDASESNIFSSEMDMEGNSNLIFFVNGKKVKYHTIKWTTLFFFDKQIFFTEEKAKKAINLKKYIDYNINKWDCK